MKGEDGVDEPIMTFSLPIPGVDGQPIGIIGVDVSLSHLSQIILSAKTSPNSYSMLLDDDGSFIVHPDSSKLLLQTDFTQMDRSAAATIKEASQAMASGETGYRPFRMNGTDYFVFYKPFKRAMIRGRTMEELDWSVGIVYPEDDIFGDYNRLLYLMLIIAVVALVLMLGLCYAFIHMQFLPLRQLAKSAKHIAEGRYDEKILGVKMQDAGVRRQDEVGRLQSHFIEMQESLSARMGEMQRLTDTLNERGRVLQAAYEQAQADESMKTNFLYNMSDQMTAPVGGIKKSVFTICDRYNSLTEEDVKRLVEDIRKRGAKVTELLNQLIKDSEKYA